MCKGNETLKTLVLRSEYWHSLILLAENKKDTMPEELKTIRDILLRTRNNITSHYYDLKNFKIGFKVYSSRNDVTPKIYAAFGQNMEETHFFYADATCQGFLDNILKKNGNKSYEDVLQAARSMNWACRNLTQYYIEIESRQIPKPNRQVRRTKQKINLDVSFALHIFRNNYMISWPNLSQ